MRSETCRSNASSSRSSSTNTRRGGIVALEDVLEELVGEIYDESDRDVLAVEHDADGALLVPGPFPIHDLVDIGVERPEATTPPRPGSSSTVWDGYPRARARHRRWMGERIGQVSFTVERQPVAVPTGDGSTTGGPVSREDYALLLTSG